MFAYKMHCVFGEYASRRKLASILVTDQNPKYSNIIFSSKGWNKPKPSQATIPLMGEDSTTPTSVLFGNLTFSLQVTFNNGSERDYNILQINNVVLYLHTRWAFTVNNESEGDYSTNKKYDLTSKQEEQWWEWRRRKE